MDLNVINEGNSCHIDVRGEMTISTAAELMRGLAPSLVLFDDIEINLAGVNEIDSAGLQLMMAAKREATARSKCLRFVDQSRAVVDVLNLCDLAGYFAPAMSPAC